MRPLSDDFFRSPRFAASAAPAAICCFLDFAGIYLIYAAAASCGPLSLVVFTGSHDFRCCSEGLVPYWPLMGRHVEISPRSVRLPCFCRDGLCGLRLAGGKIRGRDYLTVDNIAKFYGLPTGVAPVDKHLRIENSRNSVEFQLDSREVMINGVRNWLCFPVTEKNGQYLVSRVDLAKTLEPELRPQMINESRPLHDCRARSGPRRLRQGCDQPLRLRKEFRARRCPQTSSRSSKPRG